MGRQYRIPRGGGGAPGGGTPGFHVTAPYVVTSSSKLVAVPNYGYTDISTWTAGDYVLDAPYGGAFKVLVSASSSSTAVVIWGSTDNSVSMQTASGGDKKTKISFSATTGDTIVCLYGMNSTKWYVMTNNAYTTNSAPISFSS